MDNSGAILDYASPRKRGRFRLPARSTVRCAVEPDVVTITELLQGQAAAAVPALLFGLFTFAVSIALTAGDPHVRRHLLDRLDFNQLPLVLAIAEVVVAVLIVQETWRRTELSVRYDELRLAFRSPLRRRTYRWAGNDIADVVLVPTANEATDRVLAELLITRVGAAEIRLFTDHYAYHLAPMVLIIDAMLRSGEVPALPAAGASVPEREVAGADPVARLDLAADAQQTLNRLVDVHRDLRGRPPRALGEAGEPGHGRAK